MAGPHDWTPRELTRVNNPGTNESYSMASCLPGRSRLMADSVGRMEMVACTLAGYLVATMPDGQ